MASKIRVHRGRVLFHRLGTLHGVTQGYWLRAPVKTGLWAFPWPYFSMFFAAHQYKAIEPRRFSRAATDTTRDDLADTIEDETVAEDDRANDYAHWRRKVAPRVLPIRRFWFDGDLFTHIDHRGHDLGLCEWQRVTATELAERAARYLVRARRFPDSRIPRLPNVFDAEALEVFIPVRSEPRSTRSSRSRTPNQAIRPDSDEI